MWAGKPAPIKSINIILRLSARRISSGPVFSWHPFLRGIECQMVIGAFAQAPHDAYHQLHACDWRDGIVEGGTQADELFWNNQASPETDSSFSTSE